MSNQATVALDLYSKSVDAGAVRLGGGTAEAPLHYLLFAKNTGTFDFLSPEELWLAAHFTPEEQGNPVISGWQADPDGDSQTNMEEFAQSTNPLIATPLSAPTITHSFGTDAGDFLEMTIPFSAGRPVSMSVETSPDLRSWNAGEGRIEVIRSQGDEIVLRVYLDSREAGLFVRPRISAQYSLTP